MPKQLLKEKARQFIDCHCLPIWSAVAVDLSDSSNALYEQFAEVLTPMVEGALQKPTADRLLNPDLFTHTEFTELKQILQDVIPRYLGYSPGVPDFQSFQKWLDTFEGVPNPKRTLVTHSDSMEPEPSFPAVKPLRRDVPSFSTVTEQIRFDELLAHRLNELYKQPDNADRDDATLFQEALLQTQKGWQQRFSLFAENCRAQQARTTHNAVAGPGERPLKIIS